MAPRFRPLIRFPDTPSLFAFIEQDRYFRCGPRFLCGFMPKKSVSGYVIGPITFIAGCR